jgi:hypothetical protein
MGKTGRLHANSRVQATVLGPTPLKLARNCLASSSGTVLRKERSSDPRRLRISLSSSVIRTDFCFARPPDLIAASIDATRARLAASQSGNRRFKLSNARSLLALVVDCERIDQHVEWIEATFKFRSPDRLNFELHRN